MKLYEFTYTDNQNLSESRLLRRVQAFLESEALNQGWAPGYTFKQGRAPEAVEAGRQYFYEVNGRYLDSDGDEVLGHSEHGTVTPGNPAAARDANI